MTVMRPSDRDIAGFIVHCRTDQRRVIDRQLGETCFDARPRIPGCMEYF
jgi:hypothetical protein